MLIARLLGAGPVADAFLAALRLPNLVRRVLGEGGLNAPFVPLYLSVKAEAGEPAARRFGGETATHLAVLLIMLVGLGEICAPWVVLGLAGGFTAERATLELASFYTRLMLPFLLLTTLAAMLAALLNAERRFALAALAPALMNALLLGVLLALLAGGVEAVPAAKNLAIAVSLSGLAHLCLILFGFRGIGLPRPSLRWSPEMTRLVRTGGATLLAASTAQLVLVLATQIASREPGSVAALYYADRVFQLPLGFVGVAMGTVALSEMAARPGDDAALGRALVWGLALALPAATALAALSRPIISVLFEHGAFSEQDSARTAAALAAFALGLPFAVIAKVFAQVYFVRHAPRLPLVAGVAALAAMMLAGSVAEGGSAAESAALAASLAFVAQAGFLSFHVRRDGIWRPGPAALRPVLGAMAASVAMLAALLPALGLLGDAMAAGQPILRRIAALTALCGGGLAVYAIAGWAFGAFGGGGAPRLLRKPRG